ncbi:hypothetical protein ACWDZX_38850, partial [Streptomyces collinus]
MTDDAYRAALTRLAVDPGFRAELDGDTGEAARRLGLTPDQVTALRSLRVESGADGGPAALDPRLSKSSLFFGSAAHALSHHDITVPHDHTAGQAVPADHGAADHAAAGTHDDPAAHAAVAGRAPGDHGPG